MNRKIPRLKIDIRNQSDNTAVIDIDGEIGWVNENGEWNTAANIKDKLKEINELEASKIIVNINSLGGFVDDGLAIHDVLAQHEAEIETRVIGMTASAATIIAQAGDKRVMSDNALYLIHRAWGLAFGNVNDMMSVAEDLEAIDKRILNIYVKRSGRDEVDIQELMNENDGGGKWIDAEEALEFGLTDGTFEPMKAAAAVSRDQFEACGLPEPEGFEFLDVTTNQEKEKKGIVVPVNFDLKVNGKPFNGTIGELKDIISNKENGSQDPDKEVPEGTSLEEARIKEVETLI